MPWDLNDVSGFTKAAKTAKQKRRWVAVANSALKSCLDDGGSQENCEARAVRMANGVIKEDDMSEVTVTVAVPTVAENAKIRSVPELPAGTLINDIVPVSTEMAVGEVLETTDNDTELVEEVPEVEVETPEEVQEVGKRLNAKQVRNLNAALDTIKGLLGWANYEDMIPEEVVEEKFTESASGRVVGLVEAKPVLPDSVVPLHLNTVIIEPGWGNPEDGHYYPKEVLNKDAQVFKHAKMYETDHRQGEKSTRTWVSTIKEMSGFTDDGAPIALVSIHDRNFAERILALDADDLLDKMECSILAGGLAEKGKIDGKKAKIVKSITEVESVDWVTRAGAGGRAHALAETEEGSMEENETETQTEEEIKKVKISEDNDKETPAPEPLSDENVTERLGKTNLPKMAKARLSEAKYVDEGALEEAVKAEIDYVKELTGSGEPFGMDGGPQKHEPLTEEEKDARYKRRLAEVDGGSV